MLRLFSPFLRLNTHFSASTENSTAAINPNLDMP